MLEPQALNILLPAGSSSVLKLFGHFPLTGFRQAAHGVLAKFWDKPHLAVTWRSIAEQGERENNRHFEVARETRSRWLSKCIVGLFWGTHFQHGGKFVSQNSRTMHFDNHLDRISRATSKWLITWIEKSKRITELSQTSGLALAFFFGFVLNI